MRYRADIDPQKELQIISGRISRLQRQKASRRLNAIRRKLGKQ